MSHGVRRCGDGIRMPHLSSRAIFLLCLSKPRRIVSTVLLVTPFHLNRTMSTDPTVVHRYASHSNGPPIPARMLSLAHRLRELDDEQQLRELLASTLSDDCNIRHLYGAILDAIWSNKVYLVEELLRHRMPISRLYVVEAVKAKAKEVLTIFFNNGWDINKPMCRFSPPSLREQAWPLSNVSS